ncbi:unnamed protein product [Mytilus coruscus]|uniref:Transmembrane protein n=1 Tax=Mytilus coruscus TaxID=42192 RepID=A0A6J8C3A5_MYTCO|nr:unnamed protein product [Mytilus coruscus]
MDDSNHSNQLSTKKHTPTSPKQSQSVIAEFSIYTVVIVPFFFGLIIHGCFSCHPCRLLQKKERQGFASLAFNAEERLHKRTIFQHYSKMYTYIGCFRDSQTVSTTTHTPTSQKQRTSDMGSLFSYHDITFYSGHQLSTTKHTQTSPEQSKIFTHKQYNFNF